MKIIGVSRGFCVVKTQSSDPFITTHMSLSVITKPAFLHDYGDQTTVNDVPNVITQSVSALKDDDGNARSLTIGATQNLNLESRNDVNVYLGADTNNALSLYASSFDQGTATRTDTPLLSVHHSSVDGIARTTLTTPGNVLVGSDNPSDHSTQVGNVILTQLNNTQVLDTDLTSFTIDKSLLLNGNLSVRHNIVTDGNIYGANLNIWSDRDSNVHPYTRLGFGIRINNDDQLEFVKHVRFDASNAVTKKLAVFGSRATTVTSNDTSDTSYLVFDNLGTVAVASNESISGIVSIGQWQANASNIFVSGPSNVGIGTTSPKARLHVSGNVIVSDGGSLGIGTVAPPTHRLQVKGDGCFASTLTVQNSNATTLVKLNAEATHPTGLEVFDASVTASGKIRAVGCGKSTLYDTDNFYMNYTHIADHCASNYVTLGSTQTPNSFVVDARGYVGLRNVIPECHLHVGSTDLDETERVLVSSRKSAALHLRGNMFDEHGASNAQSNGESAYLYITTAGTNDSPDENAKSKAIIGIVPNSNVDPRGDAFTDALPRSLLVGCKGSNEHIQIGTSNAVHVTVTNTGNVGIGDVDPQYKLVVDGQILATHETLVTSDRRLKHDIVRIDQALDKVEQLNGYTFRRKDDTDDTRRYCGFMAQEVQRIIPEAVALDNQGYLSVAYGSTVAVLVEAIKELNGQVKTIKTMLMNSE